MTNCRLEASAFSLLVAKPGKPALEIIEFLREAGALRGRPPASDVPTAIGSWNGAAMDCVSLVETVGVNGLPSSEVAGQRGLAEKVESQRMRARSASAAMVPKAGQ